MQRGLAVIVLLVSIAVIGMMLYYAIEFWHFAFERNWRSDTVWGVRLWIPYLALPVGLGLFLLQLVADLVAVFLKIDTPFGVENS
jgi:TRAP-type C4-dicarboxylate transport system permease small subunit